MQQGPVHDEVGRLPVGTLSSRKVLTDGARWKSDSPLNHNSQSDNNWFRFDQLSRLFDQVEQGCNNNA